jgi:hypothetical protein
MVEGDQIMGRFNLLIMGLSLVFLALITLSQSANAQSGRLIVEDDFTGTDGDPPNPLMWDLRNTDTQSTVTIQSNTMQAKSVTRWPNAYTRTPITANNLEMNVDWVPRELRNGPCVITLATNESGGITRRFIVGYGPNWGWHYYVYFSEQPTIYKSSIRNVAVDQWYTVNITVRNTIFNVTVKEKVAGTVIWAISNQPTQPLLGDNMVGLGVAGSTGCYDDFRVYDLLKPPNKSPHWLRLPILQAVEDVPFTYNFSQNVTDPDDYPGTLIISSQSSFVKDISGLEVTFEFPNGVTEASVLLGISDTLKTASALVNFTITPVNDPPSHNMKLDNKATEDIPLMMDFTLFVWDIDNETSDLYLKVHDLYASAEGLNLTVIFPEGVLRHELWVNLSDGLADVEIHLTFSIIPIDDPPLIDTLGEFTAIEDQVSVFNMTTYLHDTDTPLDNLGIIAREPNCTVHGHELHFLFTLGGFDCNVEIEVIDAHNRVTTVLAVYVEEVNDAPIVQGISPKLFVEDEQKTIELETYIEDEDTPVDGLTITCDHPSVIEISGLNITLLYTTWQEEHSVEFRVFDGIAWSDGSFDVQVQSVNDPPEITRVGELTSPGAIEVNEGSELFLEVTVWDEDNSEFRYSIETDWDGILVYQNGTVRIATTKGELGEYGARLIADDRNGGTDEWTLIIKVLDVSDPPYPPTVLRPGNNTEVEEGNNVTFIVEVFDPDMAQGQTLTVTWESNISGTLMTLSSNDPLTFTTDQLAVGAHRITVTVNDGEHTSSVWFDLTVLKKHEPSEPEDDKSFITQPTGLAAIGIIILLVVLVVVNIFLSARRRRETEPPPSDESPVGAIELTVVGGEGQADVTVEMDPPPSDIETGTMPEVAMAPAAISRPSVPEPPEQLDLETVAPPTEKDLMDRAHAEMVREVMKVLTQLPRGMPTSLWGKDMATLAREIVDGPRKSTPDEEMLVKVDGKWYYADHNKIGTFLMEWKEEKEAEASKVSEDESATKFDMLETALLKGNISEETYKELKKKYEKDS